MPCPDFSIGIVQRSAGSSAVSASAYQSGSRLFCAYDMKNKDYRYKQKELFYEAVMLPDHAPKEYADREKLWNSVEEIESQWNSQLARRIRFAIPREIPPEQYIEIVREYCRKEFVSKGMIADVAIHDPVPPGHNPHAHILLTMRSLDGQGRWMAKTRKEYILDTEGNRIRTESGYWKSRKVNVNDWNDRGNCEKWRHAWEEIQNRYLEQNGREERISLKSYERQGVDSIPTVHMGPAVTHLEEKGIRTDIGDLNREIRSTNRLMAAIRNALSSLRSWIVNLQEKKKLLLEEMEKLKSPSLSELLIDYYQLRNTERESWSSKARLKGTVSDYEKLKKAIGYLHDHELISLEDLHRYIEAFESRYHGLSREIRIARKRINDIAAIQTANQTMQDLQPVHDAWMKKHFRSAKESFRNEHSEELERYQRSVGLLMKVNGSRTVDCDALDAEYSRLSESYRVKTAELEALKDELKQLRSIRYYLSRVIPEETEPERVSIEDRMADSRLRTTENTRELNDIGRTRTDQRR